MGNFLKNSSWPGRFYKRSLKGKAVKWRPILFFLMGLGVSLPQSSWAVRPMYHSIALVAGSGSQGFLDGSFTSALFNNPLGLAINKDGTLLFVADTGNNRIRVVHLDQSNRVSTLTGQDSPGSQNGPLTVANFNQPRGVLCIPGERLVVNDFGNGLLRLIDLKTGWVSNLAGGPTANLSEGPASQVSMGGIRDMAYLPEADSLFLTQPGEKSLKRLDLKTGEVTFVLRENADIPAPISICGVGGKLYIADSDRIFSMNWKAGLDPKIALIATLSSNIQALAENGDRLYALNLNSVTPLVRVLPQLEPVTFTTTSGDVMPDPGKNLPTFSTQQPPCFVSDPTDESKFFIMNPSLNIITSFRDLFGREPDWYAWRNSNGLNEDEYPAHKPPRTFRILFCGDSRSCGVVNYPFKTTWNIQSWKNVTGDVNGAPPRQVSIAKRMEVELNTLAALDDLPFNFEVLSLFHNANDPPLLVWPAYEIPDAVKKNDIDLVMIFWPPPEIMPDLPPVISYYQRPINSEGIPEKCIDPEYLLKPLQERIPEGAPRQFYEMCKARHFVRESESSYFFDLKVYKDPAFRDLLIQLYGKPFEVLKKKLSILKTSGGQPVRLLFCSAHTSVFDKPVEDPVMWKEITKNLDISFLNLNDEVSALTPSFFPLAEVGGNDHLDPDGHLFFSWLLVHDLIRDGYLPWGKTPPSNP